MGLYAQQGWFTQTSGTTNWINDVDFVDTKTGWAVGNDGIILHTTDGSSWTAQQSNTPNNLYSVKFVNNMLGWAVGAGGKILYTTDGGVIWTTQTSGTSKDLRSVFFMDHNFGWIAGNTGTMLVTDNGGVLWDPQPTPTFKDLQGMYFVDYLKGWATGKEGTILRSLDGGITWVAQTNHPLDGSLTGINACYFVDTQIGWAVAKAGNILHTTNGGNNWYKQTSGTSMGINDVVFHDANNGYVIGDNGTIKYTNNGGTAWQNQSSPANALLLAVEFPEIDTGWIVGNSGTILYTHNGGFCPVPPITSNPVSQSVCPGDTVIFAVTTTDTAVTFQWFKNNLEMPGETTSILQIDSAGIANAGAYFCELSNGCGIAKSNGAILSLKGLANISSQPVNDTVEVGEKVTIKITASGTSISFQWLKNGVEIPGATNYQYVIDSVVPADSGYYSCRISNVCNVATSDEAFLKVYDFTGIISIENEASLKFYPNPTKGLINIEIDNLMNEYINVEIINYNGQIIYKKQFGNRIGLIHDIIDLTDKSKGIYFIRFQSGKTILTEKIVLY